MNKTYDQHEQTIQALLKDQQKRLEVSRGIALNLYKKHFHNFLTPTQYKKTFPWLTGTVTFALEGPCANGSPIPEVYLSKEIWRIAQSIRQETYRAVRELRQAEFRQSRSALEEIDREAQRLEQRRAEATAQKEDCARSLRNLH